MSRPAPMVSVVVPTYQSAAFVAQTLASVLAQTHRNLDVVVADHGSTDGTWEQLAPFAADRRVRLLRTPPGGGAARNWNRVTEEAVGHYVKLVCADDLLHPTCVERQVAALEQHPQAALAAVRRDVVDASGRILLRARGLPGLGGLVDRRTAVRALVRAGSNIFGEPVCVLARTDLVRRVGGWSPSQSYLIDEELYVRLLRHGDLVAIPEPLAAFRVSKAQWSVALARIQASEARSLHRRLRAEQPDTVSAVDERLGSLRAIGTAWARRGAYVLWCRRMRATS